eukprot:5672382-Pyramimonas_sp.AAC.1
MSLAPTEKGLLGAAGGSSRVSLGVCGPSHCGAHAVQDDYSIKRGHLYGGAGTEGLRGGGREREEGI